MMHTNGSPVTFPRFMSYVASGLSKRATLRRLEVWPQASTLPCMWSIDILGGNWRKTPRTIWSTRAQGGKIQTRTRFTPRRLRADRPGLWDAVRYHEESHVYLQG